MRRAVDGSIYLRREQRDDERRRRMPPRHAHPLSCYSVKIVGRLHPL